MKTVASDERKKKMVGQLRDAVCVQSALWSICFRIDALLNHKCHSFGRIEQLAPCYGRKKICDSTLKEILCGTDESALQRLAELSDDSRCELLRATQNAIWLENVFQNEAESIAATSNCGPGILLAFLTELTMAIYDSPKIPDVCQSWFFGELGWDTKTDKVEPTGISFE